MAASSSVPVEALPYSLKLLSWDQFHHFNSQNKYSYSGCGRKLSDPALQCEMCEQWFLLKEVKCVGKEDNFVPFQRNYRFSCRVCAAASGGEQYECYTNTWTSIVLTAMYNLILSDDGTSLKAGTWLQVKDIIDWVKDHWGSLTAGRNMAQMLENSAINKCLLYTQSAPARGPRTYRANAPPTHARPGPSVGALRGERIPA